jgi:hypothetical protein
VPNDLGHEAPFALTIQGVRFAALFKKIRDFSAVKIAVEVSIGPMPSILLAATIGLATNTALAARSGSTVQELLLSVSHNSLQI